MEQLPCEAESRLFQELSARRPRQLGKSRIVLYMLVCFKPGLAELVVFAVCI